MIYYAAATLLASGLVASVSAGGLHARHANHARLHHEVRDATSSSSSAPAEASGTACSCTTYTTTWYGEPTWVPEPAPSTSTTESSTSMAPTTSSTSEASTSSPYSSTSEASTPSPYSSTSEASTSSPYSSSLHSSSTAHAPVKPTTYAAPSPSAPAAPKYHAPPAHEHHAPAAPAAPAKNNNEAVSHPGPQSPGSISSNGNKWAMTYTPYSSNGQCKSASDVAYDIGQIKAKGFTTVRLYATDCNGPQNVGSACEQNGLKMILGIYIDASGLSNAYSQVSELTSWGKSNGWDNVAMVVAGNEAIFNGYCTASELAGFIGDVKSQFKAAGYFGPCTTTEPLDIIQENASTICAAVDVIAANIHPFFNGGVSASGAGDFVSSQMSLLSDCCGGSKEAYNLETGWPSKGDANGAAVPGSAEQKEAIDSIVASAGSKSAIFSYEDDSWKAPGALGVEQWWGCASLFADNS